MLWLSYINVVILANKRCFHQRGQVEGAPYVGNCDRNEHGSTTAHVKLFSVIKSTLRISFKLESYYSKNNNK